MKYQVPGLLILAIQLSCSPAIGKQAPLSASKASSGAAATISLDEQIRQTKARLEKTLLSQNRKEFIKYAGSVKDDISGNIIRIDGMLTTIRFIIKAANADAHLGQLKIAADVADSKVMKWKSDIKIMTAMIEDQHRSKGQVASPDPEIDALDRVIHDRNESDQLKNDLLTQVQSAK